MKWRVVKVHYNRHFRVESWSILKDNLTGAQAHSIWKHYKKHDKDEYIGYRCECFTGRQWEDITAVWFDWGLARKEEWFEERGLDFSSWLGIK